MPMLRRGPDPLATAVVLRRLDGLRAPVDAWRTGWLPRAPDPVDEGGVAGLEPLRDSAIDGDGYEPSAADTAAAQGNADSRSAPFVPGRQTSSAAQAALPRRWNWRGVAFDPGRRGVVVLAVLALLGAAGGAWYFVRAAPTAGPSAVEARGQIAPAAEVGGGAGAAGPTGWPSTSASPGALSGGSSGSSPGAAAIVVDVVGKVATPGVFTLSAGSRIHDAIAAAGGVLPGTDLTALDLARKLNDGEEIFVGIPPPSGMAAQTAGGVVSGDSGIGAGAAPGTTASASVVNLNAATQADLETLPGVGAVTAQKILAWRSQHGRFSSITQLQQISGIGPSKYAALASRVTV